MTDLKAEVFGNIINLFQKSTIKSSDGKKYGKYKFYISGEKPKKINNFLIDSTPSILMSTGGSSHIYYDDGKFSYSTDTLGFTTDKNIDTKYLYYLLLANLNMISDVYFQGSGLEHLNRNYLFKSKVLIHENINYQKELALKFYKLDTLISNANSLLNKSLNLYETVLNNSFNFHSMNENFQSSKDIKTESIKNLTTLMGSGSTPKGGQKNYYKKGVPFIRSGDVKEGYLDISDIKFIKLVTHTDQIGSEVNLNDVLLNITGASIGRAAVNDKYTKANINQHVMRMRTNEKILPKYLSYFLLSNFGQLQIFEYEAGGSKEGLDKKNTEEIKINFPKNLDKQENIVNNIEKSYLQVSNLYLLINKLENIKISLLQENFKDTLIE